MKSLLLLVVICVAFKGEEATPTHFPPVELPPSDTLSPMYSKLAKEAANWAECQMVLTNSFRKLPDLVKNGEPYLAENLGPCAKCYTSGVHTISIDPKGVFSSSTHSDPESVYYKISFHFKWVHINCEGCQLTSDDGQKVNGGFNGTWHHPGMTMVITKDDARKAEADIHDVHVTEDKKLDGPKDWMCHGDENFKKTCSEAHKTRELDHIIYGAISRYIPQNKHDKKMDDDNANAIEARNFLGSSVLVCMGVDFEDNEI